MSISDEIQRLHELRQAGALTDAEFEQAKAKLLSSQVSLQKGGTGGTGGAGGGNDFAAQLGAMRRSRGDRWLAGVCGGLAKSTGADAWIWRLAFALLTLVSLGLGVVVYILMWIFVPEE
ncbi:PspC domain-containing protein [Massilia glaciei]|uniref:PspC domain-containing protein n=1 Tax=Massilia glaciei TaxID=1524097 RepID=A0A2U2I6E3_9BURK|nr:PspC domain-containing protein [Massilia glaciei]PWF55302.1 PspC domain-containing protein [Massilia glaciei]